jgi:hypothetical protein
MALGVRERDPLCPMAAQGTAIDSMFGNTTERRKGRLLKAAFHCSNDALRINPVSVGCIVSASHHIRT